ncbi:MAG: DivIVA domain-containing protein [Synergistaceae bacterium]|jgi:cell division initiation protein|nr:DivIVA domain-containing protein [Synergistaceae bacterium]
MSELLTSLDIVNQAFKKTMRGYDPSEVDEFLDKVAECIQVYVQKIKDFERITEEQSEKLRDYENIKGSLHEALLMAQKTAEEKMSNASMHADEKIAQADRAAEEKIAYAAANAENIISEARYRADRMIKDAEIGVADLGHELNILQDLRIKGFSNMRDFINEISSVLDRAESTGKIQLPQMTLKTLGKYESQPSFQPGQSGQVPQPAQGYEQFVNDISGAASQQPREGNQAILPDGTPQNSKEQLSNTLSVLGIDLNLLDIGRDKV